jgi:uncharacterized protein (TIGR00661 family)
MRRRRSGLGRNPTGASHEPGNIMRLLFVIQGEGRGHMTQAIALRDLLTRRGHTVIEALVGRSGRREIPGFFARRIGCPVRSFESPSFIVARDRGILIARSVVYNFARTLVYLQSLAFLRRRIRSVAPDLVVNFYEPMCGWACSLRLRAVPYVTLAHQYLFLHPSFVFPRHSFLQRLGAKLFTVAFSLRARRRLALSFVPMPDRPARGVYVVPPLLRTQVREMSPTRGSHILGYMLNPGYSSQIIAWHRRHPGVEAHFFWDQRDAPDDLEARPGLHFHRIQDEKFLRLMASCRGFAGTAGFESVCEAMYLRKPALLVPTAGHFEQQCNALDASRAGAGVTADSFDLDRLLALIPVYELRDTGFGCWADQADSMFLHHIEGAPRPRGARRLRNG